VSRDRHWDKLRDVHKLRVAWLVAGLATIGCSNYTSSIKADAPLHPGSAYLYGRFRMENVARGDAHGPGSQTMGLEFHCHDGATYSFGSTDTRDVQVLEIAPSKCWLVRAIFDLNGIRYSTKAAPEVQRSLDFAAGRAHYIGDYFANGTFTLNRGVFIIHQRWEWDMNPAVGDQYESTTAEMKRAFPGLASLPTDDLRLIPKEEHKQGNGIAPSPDEPPLSPRFVAELAPLIRRSYRTPAECEAACPTGRCLPYRGQSGPEMACVVRCDRNADCPTGLACSCPNSETPVGMECHPIARAPKDPLPRLCLSPAEPPDQP
jgi:hypothetical protein